MARMIIHHLNWEKSVSTDQKLHAELILPLEVESADFIKEAWRKGLYDEVAVLECNDLEDAYRMTQNGVETSSWSKRPLEGVMPAEPSSINLDGRNTGRRSTCSGDLVEVDGNFHLISIIGFKDIGSVRVPVSSSWKP